MLKTSNSVLSQYRGALMGISIILIIVFHFTDDCHYYSYHFSGWISFFWRYISSSSVDAFLFFSGLGLYYSMKKRSDVRSFYIRRLKRILIPYCIVAVPSYNLQVYYNFLIFYIFLLLKLNHQLLDLSHFSVMETGFIGILA